VLALQTGCETQELRDRVQKCFLKELRAICRELPFAQMIRRIERPGDLAALLSTVEDGATVKDLFSLAAAERGGVQAVMRRFLGVALQNCLYDIPWQAASGEVVIGISQSRHMLREVEADLSEELDRIAAKFAKNPAWTPRKRPQRRDQQSGDETTKMLGQSILGGHPR